MYSGKPVIGLAGGIGAGKSFVAHLLADEKCVVISSDDLVRQVYLDPKVVQTLRRWWGDLVLDHKGTVDRSAVARKIFSQPAERKRLEQLLHPLVDQTRQRMMDTGAANAQVPAFVWDTPLLFETGVNLRCDAVIFIDSPREVRLARLIKFRGWSEAELNERENSQMPLDKKRESSHYVITNTAGEGENPGNAEAMNSTETSVTAAAIDGVRAQVRDVLFRILASTTSDVK